MMEETLDAFEQLKREIASTSSDLDKVDGDINDLKAYKERLLERQERLLKELKTYKDSKISYKPGSLLVKLNRAFIETEGDSIAWVFQIIDEPKKNSDIFGNMTCWDLYYETKSGCAVRCSRIDRISANMLAIGLECESETYYIKAEAFSDLLEKFNHYVASGVPNNTDEIFKDFLEVIKKYDGKPLSDVLIERMLLLKGANKKKEEGADTNE